MRTDANGGLRIGYLWINAAETNLIKTEITGKDHNEYYQNLTHLNLAFVNPLSDDGKLVGISDDNKTNHILDSDLKDLVTKLKAKNSALRVGLSVGGGAATGKNLAVSKRYGIILNDKTKRTTFINTLVTYAQNAGFQYLDIEYNSLSILGYNSFVQECYDASKKKGLNLTLTLEYKYPAGTTYSLVANKVYKFDDMITQTTLDKCDLSSHLLQICFFI